MFQKLNTNNKFSSILIGDYFLNYNILPGFLLQSEHDSLQADPLLPYENRQSARGNVEIRYRERHT